MELQKLIYTVEDGIAVVTMNYMKNLNAIDEQMADELMYVVDKAEHDPDVRVLVIKGAEKAFSAGGDIGYFYKLIQAGGEVNMDGLISKVGSVADGLKKMSKIVITSVSGAAAGAGVSLAIGGDFMICADNAKFILAFVNLGLVPDTGATYLLTRLIGPNRTMELAATGRPVGAEEAKALGLAYKVTTVEELDSVTMAFAKKIAATSKSRYTTPCMSTTRSGLTKRKCRRSANARRPWTSRKAARPLWKNAKPYSKGNKRIDAVL